MRFRVLGSNLLCCINVFLASLILLFPVATSQAVSVQWDPASGPAGTWDLLASNWYDTGLAADTIWTNGEDAIFGAGVLGTGTPWTTGGLVTASGISVGSMNFNIGGYEVAGTATLTGTPVITVANLADTATISAALSGTVGFSKSGNGTLTLSGANTGLSGPVTLNAGTININNASALGTATGALVINGGTINSNVAGITTANKTQNWNGDFTFTGTQDLNLGTGNVTLGGTAGQRTVTVNAGKLTVGSINVATAGYGLTKAGPGILKLGGSAANLIAGTVDITGTLQVTQDLRVTALTGNGILQNGNIPRPASPGPPIVTYANNDKWITVTNNTDNTFNGTIISGVDSAGDASKLGLVKAGSGTLTLTNTGNVINDAITVNQGTLIFNGTHNNTTQADNVGTTAGMNAILPIQPGVAWTNNYNGGGTEVWRGTMSVGTNSTSAGAIRMSDSTSSLTTFHQLGIGTSGYGVLTQSAGTITVGGFIALGNRASAGVMGLGGIINQSGGTITLTAAPITVGYGDAFGRGVLNLSGTGVFNLNGPAGNGVWIGEVGSGVLNISGSAALNINSGGTLTGGGGLVLGRGNGTLSSGIVNLLGGTVSTPFVTMGTGTGILNFNGGTLKANASSTTFMTGLTNVYVNGPFGTYSGGGTIDNDGNAITIDQALIAPPTGSSGVSASGLTVSGTGYIGTPRVIITNDALDTTGVGSTAVATIDSSGNLTGITITNPGVGYSLVPTFTLVGGGNGNTGAIGGAATLVANTSGGMTFAGSGSGVTTLNSVNTYTGPTTVSSGTLLMGPSGSINTSSNIIINGSGARLAQNSFTSLTPAVTVTNGTLDGTGTVASVVTVGNGTGGIIANGGGGTGALTIDTLTFSGVASMNLNNNSSSTTPLIVTTNLNTNALSSNKITINASNSDSYWTAGVYNLVSYTNITGAGFSAFQLGTVSGLNAARNQLASLTNVSGNIAMTITGENPVWTGLKSGDWTTGAVQHPRTGLCPYRALRISLPATRHYLMIRPPGPPTSML